MLPSAEAIGQPLKVKQSMVATKMDFHKRFFPVTYLDIAFVANNSHLAILKCAMISSVYIEN